MKLAAVRAGVIFLFATLLQSCGGGGGGAGGGNDHDPVARLSISSSSVSASATPGELAPEDEVALTIANPPNGGLWVQTGYSTSGLERIDFTSTSVTAVRIQLFFKPPGSLNNGTYEDSIEVHVCPDDQCRNDISGSPKTVQVSYVISGDGLATATISDTTLEVSADHRVHTNPEATTTVTLSTLPPSGILMQAIESSPNIQHVGSIDLEEIRDVNVTFRPPSQLNLGNYNDTIALKLCYDETCVRQVSGSPFTISTTYNVTLGIESGLSSLQVERREALGHDVIDAEYSPAMNAIVTVGSFPVNAIYVYDLGNGVESQQALSKAPTSVSVSPDGLTAAVGHDALVSVVDLPMVGAAAAPAPILLDVTANVSDLVLDGAGHVFATPPEEQDFFMHSIDIATNTEQKSPRAMLRIKLQPNASRIYGTPGSVPSELDVLDVSTGVATWLYNWGYYGERDACLDFWFNASGDRIYTACGQTFTANAEQAQDMLYTGSMVLTDPATWSENSIRSLSHRPATHEIALVEWHRFNCNPFVNLHPCFTRLAYYDDEFLNLQAVYGIGPVTIGGVPYAHLGRYVFHGPDGKKYLIGEIEDAPSEELRFWLSVVHE